MAIRVDPRADRSRSAALEAARRILVEEGWDALTHARLAEQSGLHRMTIYRHWPTTTAILADLLAQECSEIDFRSSDGDLRNSLLKAVALIKRELIDRDLGRILTALIDRGEWDTDLHDIKTSMTRTGMAPIHTVIERAVERGELSPTLDPAIGVALLVGPIVFRYLLSGEPVTLAVLEQVVDSFLAAHR